MRKRSIMAIVVVLLLSGSMSIFSDDAFSLDTITGRTAVSTGLPSSGTYTTITVADVDDDGLDEMYIGGTGYQTYKTQGIASYEYNTTTSSWSSFASGLPGTSSGKYYGKMSFGDIDEDGDLDLVAGIHDKWSDSSGNGVQIYTSNGISTFTLAHTISTGTGSSASVNEVVVADVDGDDNLDIVVAENSGVRVFFGSGSTTTWTESSPSATNAEIDGIGVGDLNNDGLLDVVGTLYTSAESKLFIQGSSRSWTNPTFVTAQCAAFGVRIADLDSDGNNDVVYGTRNRGIKVFLGNGGGSSGGTSFTWTASNTGLPTNNGDWMQLEVDDINDDDKPDIVCSTRVDDRTHVYLNNLTTGWNEIFTGTSTLDYSADGYAAAFGDWDGDNYLDVAGGSWGGGAKAWLITRSTQPPPPINQRPTPVAGDDIQVMLGGSVLLDGINSTDSEDAPGGDIGGSLFYDWNFTKVPSASQISDLSLTPLAHPSKANFTPDTPGIYELTLAVKDTDDAWSNLTDEDTISILVIKPNDPPVADAGYDQSGYEGDTFVMDGSGSSDPDGEIVEFEWTCTNHTVTFTDQDTGHASFTPAVYGRYRISLRVRDNNDTWSSSDTMEVNVVEIGQNVPPTANAGTDQEVITGTVVTLDGSASSDLDGSILTWDWTCSSHTVTFTDLNSSSPSFTASEEGTYMILLRVKDDDHSWSNQDIMEVISEVQYVNVLPIADAGDDLTVYVDDTVTLDGTGSSDPGGNVIAYNWTCTSHSITLSNDATSGPSFIPTGPGTYIFTLAVSDNDGAWSIDDEVKITVTERQLQNMIPVADAGDDVSAFVGDTVTLDGTGSSDPDGDVISYKWTCTSHSITLSNDATPAPSFIPSEPGMFIFTLTVLDNDDAWSFNDDVKVTVTERPSSTFNIDIGPFLYDNDDIITEGTVKLVISSVDVRDYNLGTSGVASFSTIAPGTYSVSLEVGGEVVVGPFDVTISSEGGVSYSGGSIPKLGSDDPGPNTDGTDNTRDDDGINPLFIIMPITFVLVLAGAGTTAFFMMKNNKKEDEDGDHPLKNCPECSSQMEFREDFEKYYCDECGRYR